MKIDQKDYEVIVPPTDILEKELDDLLGGAGDECPGKGCKCYSGSCNGINCNCKKMNPDDTPCPEGMVWEDSFGGCVPYV